MAGGFGSLEQAAEGIVAVANAEMVRAIRLVSIERGHDPRGLELIAFGGAGPLHACQVAEALDMRRVLVPAASGVLSALGIAAGERRRDAVRSVMQPLSGLHAAELRALVPWPDGARGDRRHATAELRYRGQGFELEVDLEPAGSLAERFHRRHAERFGHDDRDAEIELVNLRAARSTPPADLRLARLPRTPRVQGPGLIHLDGATLWVAPGWTASRRNDGSWKVSR